MAASIEEFIKEVVDLPRQEIRARVKGSRRGSCYRHPPYEHIKKEMAGPFLPR